MEQMYRGDAEDSTAVGGSKIVGFYGFLFPFFGHSDQAEIQKKVRTNPLPPSVPKPQPLS